MTDRKQTPDVLADILGGAAPQAARTPEPAPPSEPKPSRRTGSGSTRKRTGRSSKKVIWEYLLVSFQEYKGWRPRFVNGQEVADWMSAPIVHEYVNQLGEDGWELTSASAGQSLYGLTDRRQMYFKRPKK